MAHHPSCSAVAQKSEEKQVLLIRIEYASLKQHLTLTKAIKILAASQRRLQFSPQDGSQKAISLAVPRVCWGVGKRKPFSTFLPAQGKSLGSS